MRGGVLSRHSDCGSSGRGSHALLHVPRQVTLDQYASMTFGKYSGKQDAWICASEEANDGHDECNYVMHMGEMVWACI